MSKTFAISVVIPAYNCAEYLPDAIESVLKQDIGFEENIQLVLVNDGSSDTTSAVCREYCNAFPLNIKYIEQENSGVNAARIAGYMASSGPLVNFLDADDMWSADAFSTALETMAAHPEVPFCAAQHVFFGAREGNHPLSYKYRYDAVVDLLREWDKPNLSLNNLFIRRELINPDFFDLTLKVSEDFLAVNLILIGTPRYALMKRPVYWYRKREAHNSAIDTSASSLSYYLDPPEKCLKALFEASRERYGEVLPFIQFAVMYDLQWRIKSTANSPLTNEQIEAYRATIVGLLNHIDDSIILQQHNIGREHKLYILAMKHGKPYDEVQKGLKVIGESVWLSLDANDIGRHCWSKKREIEVHVDFMSRVGDAIVLEGRLNSVFSPDRLALKVQQINQDGNVAKETTVQLFKRHDRIASSFFDRGFGIAMGFKAKLHRGTSRLVAVIDQHDFDANMTWGKFSKYAPSSKAYTPFGDIAVRPGARSNELKVETHDNVWFAKREILFEKSLANEKWARNAFKYRHIALSSRKSKKKLWLISDRPNLAGDNGEALFEYLQKHPLPDVEAVFVLSEDSPDYARMSKIGKTVAFNSEAHRRLHMKADLIISSAADEFIYTRFDQEEPAIKQLEKYRFVFLQHGITQNDVSRWLGRYNKNISLLITASERERDAFLSNPAYAYDSEVIACTGFPRHDKLLDLNEAVPTEKQVLIAPTWRQHIAGPINFQKGIREENPYFEESTYFNFYNRLINDPELKRAASELGYSIRFAIHPALINEGHKFSSTFATIVSKYNYPLEFSKAAIMVTDYSSVAFDFSLLKKPLIYTQSDFDEFYEYHAWNRGYFNYEKDGFGEVCTSYSDTLETLIATMRNPVMPQKYCDRVDSFLFTPQDGTSRCELVIGKLRDLG